ncbi:MAG: hypothetical protein WAL31_06195, partial [Gaiellaceae bacterium]
MGRQAFAGFPRPRIALAVAVIGVVAASDIWVATDKSPDAALIAGTHMPLNTISLAWPPFFSSPAWVVPSALGIGLIGLAAAAIALRLKLTAVVLTVGAGIAGAVALHAYL